MNRSARPDRPSQAVHVIGLVGGASSTRFDGVTRGVIDWQRRTGRIRAILHRRPSMLTRRSVRQGPEVGYILFSRQPPAYIRMLQSAGKQVVAIDGDWLHEPVPTVCVDDLAIGRVGAEFFLARHYRSLAYVGFEHPVSHARATGFVERARRDGCEAVLSVLRSDPTRMPSWEDLYRQSWLRRWLPRLETPAGVLAFNDEIATHVCRSAQSAGLGVPEDVSVLAVDNSELICEAASPTVSSIDVRVEALGRHAAELLADLLDGLPAPDSPIVLSPSDVVQRESTAYHAVRDPFAAKALAFLEQSASEGIDVEDVADHAGVSRSTLERIFRRTLGISPAEQLRRARIDRARQLLRHSSMPLPDVAVRSGFEHASSLARAFKQATGMTPGDYRDAKA
jgi:LacI family transcriptional regulator